MQVLECQRDVCFEIDLAREFDCMMAALRRPITSKHQSTARVIRKRMECSRDTVSFGVASTNKQESAVCQ